MKYADSIAAIVVVAVAIGGATYWFGIRENAPAVATSNAANSAPGARKVLYYRNPMGQPDTSPVPKKDSMGMDYIPVFADEPAAKALPSAQVPAPENKGRILYYRNPMGQPDTSPVPKKDSMGMDYIPVFADEPAAKVSPAAPAPATENKGQILYYRNPMGLPDTSPVPKKDSMGMDYIPVYAGNAPDS